MRDFERISAVIMRGGTSKAVFLKENEIPRDPELRDRLILRLFGSPDVRQIDGLGGADPLTSKLAIIGPSSREDADVDYTFAYVGVDKANVDFVGNCGNISSAVGPYAIDEGLVRAVEPVTTVRVYNTNTGKVIIEDVPVRNGRAVTEGSFSISGVPGTGAKINLSFPNSQGAVTGKLLPTGQVRDRIELDDGRTIEVSMVDATTPAIFARAEDIGLTGAELPKEFDSVPGALDRIEEIRRKGADRMGLYQETEAGRTYSAAIPKVAIVARPARYTDISDSVIEQDGVDLLARTKALGVIHKAYAITGGICTAAAAVIPGTVVNEMLEDPDLRTRSIRLGHPSGVMEFDVSLTGDSPENFELTGASVCRTARRLMDGYAYVPASIYE